MKADSVGVCMGRVFIILRYFRQPDEHIAAVLADSKFQGTTVLASLSYTRHVSEKTHDSFDL